MKRPADYFEKMGRQLWFKGEYYRALKLMQEGLSYYPSDFRLKLGVALAQLRLGNYAMARDILKEILDSSPNNGDALSALCESYLSLGKKQDALDCAAKIFKYHSHSSTLMEHLGMALLEHGLFDEAARAFKTALKLEPNHPYSRLGLGIVYSGMRKHKKAMAEIRKSLRLKPDFYEAMSYLGNLLYDQGHKGQAVKIFAQIPVDALIDPVTISRLNAYAKTDKKLLHLVPELERRIEKISKGQSISGFLHSLEERAAHALRSAKTPPARFRFIKTGPENVLLPAQKTALADLENMLKELFHKPHRLPTINEPPNPSRSRLGEADAFVYAFALYLKSISDNIKQLSGLPMTRWSEATGIDSIAPYAVAVIRIMQDENAQFGVTQSSMDALLAAIVNIVKLMPPELRGSEWLVELGGIIVAFWTPVDMLDRLFLMCEILSPLEKKSLEPVIARGRGWRKWLGYRQDCKWTSPAAQLIPSLPQTYGARKPIYCISCKNLVNDYWDIAQPGDTPPVKCGDCSLQLRCMNCKGPMRHVATARNGAQIYRCMECEKRYQIKMHGNRKKK
jgi:Flp pilus assembly protein TadD